MGLVMGQAGGVARVCGFEAVWLGWVLVLRLLVGLSVLVVEFGVLCALAVAEGVAELG